MRRFVQIHSIIRLLHFEMAVADILFISYIDMIDKATIQMGETTNQNCEKSISNIVQIQIRIRSCMIIEIEFYRIQ